eukprot:749080-Hanusia_phi.AAC.4
MKAPVLAASRGGGNFRVLGQAESCSCKLESRRRKERLCGLPGPTLALSHVLPSLYYHRQLNGKRLEGLRVTQAYGTRCQPEGAGRAATPGGTAGARPRVTAVGSDRIGSDPTDSITCP